MSLRRKLSDRLGPQGIPAEAAPQLDAFEKGVADALARRGIAEVPGRKTAAEIAHDAHRQRVKDVVAALTPRPPAPDPEPEPVRESLPDQLKAMIAQQHGAELPLNGTRLTDHLVRQLKNPGADSAASGQQAEPQ
jgi:NADPH-dependent glutamate synthase beta subunit-like oxidoreductase